MNSSTRGNSQYFPVGHTGITIDDIGFISLKSKFITIIRMVVTQVPSIGFQNSSIFVKSNRNGLCNSVLFIWKNKIRILNQRYQFYFLQVSATIKFYLIGIKEIRRISISNSCGGFYKNIHAVFCQQFYIVKNSIILTSHSIDCHSVF